MQNNCSNKEVIYAGFWVRLFAYMLDTIILLLGLVIVDLLLRAIVSLAQGTPLGGNLLFHYTLKDIVLYGLQVMYFILFTYTCGTTPGKKVLNLRVVRADEEEKLSFFDVLYRETVGRFLCTVTLNIGYILIGIDGEKRGLHDILCDTRVIYAKKIKVYSVRQSQGYEAMAVKRPEIGPELRAEGYRMVGEAEVEGTQMQEDEKGSM